MKNLIVKISATLLIFTSAAVTTAQTPDYDEQVTIIAPYVPSVSDANKIVAPPDDFEIDIDKTPVAYDYSEHIGITHSKKPGDIDILDTKKEEMKAKRHIFYGKFGFGSNIEPLANIYVNSFDNNKLGGGFHVYHNSAWRQMPKACSDNSYSNTNFSLYGKLKTGNTQLQIEGGYGHNYLHYYGLFPYPEVSPEDRDWYSSISGKTFQSANASFIIHNIKRTDYDYNASLQYSYFQDRHDSLNNIATAHDFSLPVDFTYYPKWIKNSKFEKLNVFLRADFAKNSYMMNALNTIPEYTDFSISLSPSYTMTFGAFDIKLGFDLATGNEYNADTSSVKFHIHPIAEIKATIVPEAFSMRVGIKGETYRNTYQSLISGCKYYNFTFNVPYLQSPTALTDVVYDIYGFFNTRFGKYVNFSAGVDIINVNNKPLYYSNLIAYIDNEGEEILNASSLQIACADLNQVVISADLTIDSKKNFIFNLNGKYNFNELKNAYVVVYAYNLPDFEIYASAKYMFLKKKLATSLNAYCIGPRMEFAGGDMFHSPMKTVVDLGLSVEYFIKEGISVWINANNLLHYNNIAYIYERYAEYPANVMLGATISL